MIKVLNLMFEKYFLEWGHPYFMCRNKQPLSRQYLNWITRRKNANCKCLRMRKYSTKDTEQKRKKEREKKGRSREGIYKIERKRERERGRFMAEFLGSFLRLEISSLARSGSYSFLFLSSYSLLLHFWMHFLHTYLDLFPQHFLLY